MFNKKYKLVLRLFYIFHLNYISLEYKNDYFVECLPRTCQWRWEIDSHRSQEDHQVGPSSWTEDYSLLGSNDEMGNHFEEEKEMYFLSNPKANNLLTCLEFGFCRCLGYGQASWKALQEPDNVLAGNGRHLVTLLYGHNAKELFVVSGECLFGHCGLCSNDKNLFVSNIKWHLFRLNQIQDW